MTTPRTFEYTDAVRQTAPLILGIMGPSGGGKSYSALRLATGIQQVSGGDIAVADTETGRALKLADFFKFKHIPFAPPFRSLDYLAVGEHAVKMGAKTLIIDSGTHEHAGVGGYLEYAESELDRMAGDNWGKRQACKLASFIKPAQDRRKMIDGLLALGINLILTFRAKEKVKPLKDQQGKTEITNIGFMPIGSSELVFEMDACCLLLPHAGGVPTWISEEVGEQMMIKSAKQFDDIFKERKPMDEMIGRQLAEWAAGTPSKGSAPSERKAPAPTGANAETLTAIQKAITAATAKRPDGVDERAHKQALMEKYWKTKSWKDIEAMTPKQLEDGLFALKSGEEIL